MQRPRTVPAGAQWIEQDQEWELGPVDADGKKHGDYRYWRPDGTLCNECNFVHGTVHGPFKRFHENGEVSQEGAFEDGVIVGTIHARRSTAATTEHMNAPDHVWRMEIDYEDGEVSAMRCYDRDGTLLDQEEDEDEDGDDGEGEGEVADAGEDWPEVFANERRPAARWGELVATYLEEGEAGLALCAAARAAAESGSAAELTALAARRKGKGKLPDDAGPQEIVAALAEGADAAVALRALAVALESTSPARSRPARDLIEAAILLAPKRREYLFNRGLIRMSIGDHAGALADVEALAGHSKEESAFLSLYLRVLFPRFDFWPARVKPETYYDGLPEAPVQGLEAVRATAQKYATRILQLRERMLAFGPASAPWMLPDLSALLPDGPVALRSGELEIPDPEDPGNPYVIEVNEELDLSGGEGLPDLLRYARGEWAALAWLCWSCGLGRVALPEAIEAPADFGAAAGMSQQRVWRCHHKQFLGGDAVRAQGTPSFAWEGVDLDDLPDPMVNLPGTEYEEMQAMFRWLSDAAVQSPWQDNLRES